MTDGRRLGGAGSDLKCVERLSKHRQKAPRVTATHVKYCAPMTTGALLRGVIYRTPARERQGLMGTESEQAIGFARDKPRTG